MSKFMAVYGSIVVLSTTTLLISILIPLNPLFSAALVGILAVSSAAFGAETNAQQTRNELADLYEEMLN